MILFFHSLLESLTFLSIEILAVTDEHLTGHLRVVALCVAEVNDCPCYPVRHLVRVARVHFFKHDFRFYGVNFTALKERELSLLSLNASHSLVEVLSFAIVVKN